MDKIVKSVNIRTSDGSFKERGLSQLSGKTKKEKVDNRKEKKEIRKSHESFMYTYIRRYFYTYTCIYLYR